MNVERLLPKLVMNNTVRVDCWACGGEKTLGVTKKRGRVTWNCFRAMCDESGAHLTEMSQDELREALRERDVYHREAKFELSKDIIKGIPNGITYNYLLSNNCLSAVQRGYIKSGFDPLLNRIVFFSSDGAIGRSVNKRTKPKWYKYPGSKQAPMCIGKGSTAVLVEDAASACSIAANDKYTGVAMLGTNYFPSYSKYLEGYDEIIIALDKDATNKSFDIKNQLTYYFERVRIWMLEKDLKYIDCSIEDNLKEVVKNYE